MNTITDNSFFMQFETVFRITFRKTDETNDVNAKRIFFIIYAW